MLIVILSLTLLLVSSSASTKKRMPASRRSRVVPKEVERRELSGYARQEKRSEDLNDEEVPKTKEVVSVQVKKRERGYGAYPYAAYAY